MPGYKPTNITFLLDSDDASLLMLDGDVVISDPGALLRMQHTRSSWCHALSLQAYDTRALNHLPWHETLANRRQDTPDAAQDPQGRLCHAMLHWQGTCRSAWLQWAQVRHGSAGARRAYPADRLLPGTRGLPFSFLFRSPQW